MKLQIANDQWTIFECTDEDITMLRCALNWAALYLSEPEALVGSATIDKLKQIYNELGGRNWKE